MMALRAVSLCSTRLRATHAIAAIQAFIAGAAADGDMSAGITGWCVALHAFGCRIYCVQSCLRLYCSGSFGSFGWLGMACRRRRSAGLGQDPYVAELGCAFVIFQ